MGGSKILHAAGIRIRVVGSGNLRPTMQGYDDIRTRTLQLIVMSSTSFKEKTRLTNFKSQAIKLKLETTAINEIMRVNHIWVYIKALYTDYPSGD